MRTIGWSLKGGNTLLEVIETGRENFLGGALVNLTVVPLIGENKDLYMFWLDCEDGTFPKNVHLPRIAEVLEIRIE